MSLHVGSLLAVLFFFKNDFFSVVKNKNLFFKIAELITYPLFIGKI